MDFGRNVEHLLPSGGGRVGWEAVPSLYVAATAHGTWRVSVTPDGYGTEHPDRETALAAARRASRRQWEHTGEPCLLRVREADGSIAVVAAFRDAN
jgi:hypothetical protein